MATLAGGRSLPTLQATFEAQKRLQAALTLPKLDPGFSYLFPTVRPMVDAQNHPLNFEEAVQSGVAQGVKIVKDPPKPSIWDEILSTVSIVGGIIAAPFTGGSSLIGAASTVFKEGTRPTVGYQTLANVKPPEKPMGLFDDIWGGVQSAASAIFPTNAGIDWNNVLNQGIGLATTALAPRYSAPPSPMAQPTSLAGAVPMAARAGAVVARGFFNRFPNLATSIQTLRNGGMNVTRSKLYGVMKRFGPEFLVTGGLLTAAAVNELAVAGPGYRRMNPANTKALRRSVRRIESFHRLCKTTDRLRGTSRRRKAHC